MQPPLLDIEMSDGSRKFAELPETAGFNEIRTHSALLKSSVETDFITDNVTEMWLDFSFRDHSFCINNQFGEYWFFVKDPSCPNSLLMRVRDHFSSLLCK